MDEMADKRRLQQRGETWHYHRRVPAHLVPVIGQRFIRRALRTDSLRAAQRLRSIEDARTDAMFQAAEKGHAPAQGRAGVSLESLTGYVRDAVDGMDRKASERLALDPPADREELADLTRDAEIQLGILTDPGDPRRHELVARAAQRIAYTHGADLTDATVVAQFAEVVRRGLIEVARRKLGRLEDANGQAFHDTLFDPATEESDANVTEGIQLIADDDETADIVDLWAAERKPRDKTIASHRAAARRFYDAIGERKAVAAITKTDVLAYKAKLVEGGQSAANIKTLLAQLRTLLQWAADNGHAAANAATGVTIKDTKTAKEKRKPFGVPALNAIFSGDVYAEGVRPTQGRGEAAYWLPLLALFTGARLEELGQLRPEDVQHLTFADANGHDRTGWFIHIVAVEGENGTELKNAASERLVPVHPELEARGFIAYAEGVKAAGHARLFPRLTPGAYGKLTLKWGQWFSGYLRLTCGVADKRMVFHSFRHSFKDMARHAGVLEGVARQIMGHAGGDVADSYGSGYSLFQLVEGMAKIKAVGVKLPAGPTPPY